MFKEIRKNAAVMCGLIAVNGDSNVSELYRALTEVR